MVRPVCSVFSAVLPVALLLGFFVAMPAHGAQGMVGLGGARLDPASNKCVRCHEGILSGTMVSHLVAAEHPVGVDYAELSRINSSLVKPKALDKAIRLVDGRISCVTCHVPYDRNNHLDLVQKRRTARQSGGPDPMLSIDNAGSRLCMGCHRK